MHVEDAGLVGYGFRNRCGSAAGSQARKGFEALKPGRATKPAAMLSRTDAVANWIRDAIISGDLAPGERLNLDELAERLGVSRMPVREALKQLATEGFVTFFPYRGVEVSALSADEIEELYAMRVLLERRTVERAATRLDAATLEEMREILERMDAAIAAEDTLLWLKLNEEFHRRINNASGWPRMVEMVDMLRRNIERYVQAFTARTGFEGPQGEHWALYEACRAGDADRASEVITAHLENTANRLIADLRREDSSDQTGGEEADRVA